MTRNALFKFLVFCTIAAFGCEEEIPPPRQINAVATTVSPSSAPTPPTSTSTPSPTTKPPLEKIVLHEVGDGGATVTNLLDEARLAISTGDLDRGLSLSERSVKNSPKRSAAWNTLGRAQLQKGQRRKAIESFEHAVELNPQSSYAQNNLGLALIYDGRYEDAVAALEEATENGPVEGYMWNNLGMAYEHLDRLEEARDAYGKASELNGFRASANLERLRGVKTVRTAHVELPSTEETH